MIQDLSYIHKDFVVICKIYRKKLGVLQLTILNAGEKPKIGNGSCDALADSVGRLLFAKKNDLLKKQPYNRIFFKEAQKINTGPLRSAGAGIILKYA